MQPNHIEFITAIAELGSISAAAKRLRKSQPAVTKALKQIETEIGTPLFSRTAHGVVPTIAGEAVIERCRRIHSDLRRLNEELGQIQGDQTGRVDIIVSPMVALKLVPPASKRFRQRFPKIQLTITGGHAPRAFAPLRRGDVDFVIGPAPTKDMRSGLVYDELFKTPISFVTGSTSKYRHTTDLKILSLAEWVVLGPDDDKPAYRELFELHGLEPARAVATSDSVLSVLAMLEDSDLICSFPTPALADFQKCWNIVEIPIKEIIPDVSIALTQAKDTILTPPATIFADLIREASTMTFPKNPIKV